MTLFAVDITKNGKTLTQVRVKRKDKPKPAQKEQEDKNSLTTHERQAKTMSFAKYEGAFKAAKTGLTSNYIVPFALSLGFTPGLVAILSSLPQLFGASAQILSDKLSQFLKSRHKVLYYASTIESFHWLIVSLIALFSINYPALLIILIVLDTIMMNIQSPIWNALMGDTVPGNKLGKYFSERNIITGLSGFILTLLAGFILSKFSSFSNGLGFFIIFFLAFASSFIASKYQRKFYDPNPSAYKSEPYTLVQFIKNSKQNNFGSFTIFYSLYRFSVNIAAPFFTIYMLQILKFDYFIFTIVTVSAAISSFLSMKWWGSLIDKYGSRSIFTLTSLIIPAIPLAWIFTADWRIISGIEIFSGFIWAGFNLSCSTFMLESVNSKQRIKFYAYNNMISGFAVFIGTIIGSFLLTLPEILFSSSYLFVFFVSSIMRFLVAFTLTPRIKEEKVVSIKFKEKEKTFFSKFITLRPKEGIVYEPIGRQEYSKDKSKETNQKANKKKKLS